MSKAVLTNVERDPAELRPWPNNPRRHSKKQLRLLADNMRRFGPTSPALIDENNTILAGHARIEVARSVGLGSYPCRQIVGLTNAEKHAVVVADNKIAINSTWDNELLVAHIEAIRIEQPEIVDLLGFEPVEIDSLVTEQAPADRDGDADDDVIPKDGPSVTRPGDIWICGSHSIICGDSRLPATFDALLGDDRAEMVVCDSPYNVKIAGHVSGLGKVRHREFAMAAGEMSENAFTDFLSKVISNLVVRTADGSIHFHFMDWRHTRELQRAADPHYIALLNIVVWDKVVGGMGSLYRSRHELVFVYKAGDAPHINNIQLGKHGRNRSNVWQYRGLAGFSKGRGEQLEAHPTAKPVAMVADAMRDCSKRGSIILDPFGGFGSTMIAAERTGRRARLIEIDPIYVDRTVRRWQRIAKDDAINARTGLTFGATEHASLSASRTEVAK